MKKKSKGKLRAKQRTVGCKKLLGFVLSIALLLESSGMQAFATEMQENISDMPETVNIDNRAENDEAESAGENPADKDTGTVDGGDTDIASGTYNGMDWRIDKDGLLTIGGKYLEDDLLTAPSWLDYKYRYEIVNVKVSATNVTSTKEWFENCSNLQKIDLTMFDTANITNMSDMFAGCYQLTSLDICNFDTTNVTDMSYMFDSCSSLTSLNLSNFDTANVTDMSYMFDDCFSLTSLNLSNFDTANVTDMSSMFSSCHSLTSLDLSNFNTSNITNMSDMFAGCYQLTSLDICNFDTTNVTSMNSMFYQCSSLPSLNLSNFDTNQARDMGRMFGSCNSLAGLDLSNINLSQSDTEIISILRCCNRLKWINTPINLTVDIDLPRAMIDADGKTYTKLPKGLDKSIKLEAIDKDSIASGIYNGMDWRIDKNGLLTINGDYLEYEPINDLYHSPHWLDYRNIISSAKVTASHVTSTDFWFARCYKLQKIDLTEFDTSKLTDTWRMFSGCSALTKLDFGNFYTSNVKDMSEMFNGCSALTSLDLSKFNTSNVEYMHGMFRDCSALTSLDFGNFNTSNVKDMSEMFRGCSALTSLDLGNFNTSNVTAMSEMFRDCESLTDLNLSNFDTSNVQYMNRMFRGCSALTNLDMSNFATANAVGIRGMFEGCKSLAGLDLSHMDLSNLDPYENSVDEEYYDPDYYYDDNDDVYNDMLNFCGRLKWINTPINLHFDIDLPHAMTDAEGNTYTKLPLGLTTSIKLTRPSTGGETEDKDNIASGTYYGMVWHIDKVGLLTVSGEYQEDVHSDKNWQEYTDKIKNVKVTASGIQTTKNWFMNCTDLTGIDLSSMDVSKLESADQMLDHCDNLEWISTPTNLSVSIALPFPMSDENENAYTTLPLNQAVSLKLTYTENFAVTAIADQTYTGKAINPDITVSYGKRILTPGIDYTVTYKNNTNAAAADSAKAPAIIVKGKGNYTDSITQTFTILAKSLTESNAAVASMTYTADGKTKKSVPSVTANGVKLKSGKDFIAEFPDTGSGAYQQPGRYNVTIKGTGNYQGTVTAVMVILSEDQIQASRLKIGKLPACTYTEGTPAAPVPTVTYAGKTLVPDKDYAISYRNNDRAGKATLIVTGLENTDPQGVYIHGTVEKTFSIKGTALSKAKISYDNQASFTGNAICPAVTLTLNGTALRPDTDYTVSYSHNINAGKATITLTGRGGYTGTVKKTFTIRPAETAADNLNVSFDNGSATAFYNQSGAKPAVTVTIGKTVLRSGKDYSVTYKNNKKTAAFNATKAPTIIIKGKGNYKFQKSLTFSILEKALSDSDITVTAPDVFSGTKKSLLSVPVLTDGNGKKLKAGRDYTVTGYFINGQAFDGQSPAAANTFVTVRLRGTGSYTGETKATYRIASKDISKTKVTVSPIEFTGGTTILTDKMIQEGKIKVTDKATGQELVYGTDYIITGYKNNSRKGKATLTLQGIGKNYGGTKVIKFSIVARKFKK